MTSDHINQLIKENNVDTNLISDGYHTFGELYEHRIILYIALCRAFVKNEYAESNERVDEIIAWRSKVHSDGTSWDGWFLLGICRDKGHQITYHLPEKYWNECDFAETLDKAPEFDGHTSQDVLERLKNL